MAAAKVERPYGRDTLTSPLPQAGEEFFGVDRPYLLPATFAWIVLGAIALLLGVIVYMTFVPRLPTEPGFTLQHWRNVARPFVIERVLPNTAIVGLGSVTVTVLFAAPLSWLLNRTTLPGRNLFLTLMGIVILVPGFIQAMGWLLLVNERIGLFNRLLAGLLHVERVPINLNNPLGMAWVMGLAATPTMLFLLSGPMRMLDPALEDAASVSGASRWWTFIRVTMPLMWPALLGGAIYVLMSAVSWFEIPAMLGASGGQAPVLSTELFYSVQPLTGQSTLVSYGAAGVYGVIIAIPSLVGMYFYYRVLARGQRYAVVTGKGFKPRDVDLGRAGNCLAFGFIALYLLLAVVLPVLVLLWLSLFSYVQVPSLEALAKASLSNYRPQAWLATIGGPAALRNTALLMLCAPILVLFFAMNISWVVVRSQLAIRRLMDNLAMLPHAVPGLAFAFALFIVALVADRWLPWLPLAGSLGLIVIANTLNHLPYSTRITNAALLQVHQELEEQARLCGAGPLAAVRRIVAPLARPSLVFAGLWTALLTFREVSMALFLAGPRNSVLSVAVWRSWQQGSLGPAAAAAVVMLLLIGGLVLLALLATGGRALQQRQGSPIAAVAAR
ncbi:MAG TPA: ABC transporter permease subunit [Chloroflexota bacterium]|nr:ABC transporter permease subunit [Chloroflexota bacterium]